jgi:phage shock protein E
VNIDPVTAAVVAVVGWLVVRKFLKGGTVSKDVVMEKIKAGAQVVDVRTPEEFRGGAYPGAVNIPVQELARRLGEVKKDRAVVVYCASGGRSGVAAQLLKREGYADVVNAGGLGDMPR